MPRLLPAVTLVLGSVFLAVLTMCGEKPVPPRVSEIHVQPSKRIDAEGTASLTVEASGKELQFKWSAARGRVSSPSAPSVVYTAPSAAGQDTVTVEVTGAGGTTVQSATFEVVPAAAPAEQNPTAQAVSITSHHKDQTVSCEEPVQGRYAPSVTGPIWPVVYVGGRYHPQDEGGQPATMSDGEWYGTVRFGDCSNPAGDEGRTFQLFVVTVDETANAAILKYFERTRKTGKYPGLIRLPKGTREYPPRLLVRRS